MSRSSDSTNRILSVGTADQLARAITGHGFGTTLTLPSEPVADRDFDELLGIVWRERLTGAVAELAVAGTFPVTDRQWTALADAHADWARHTLEVERLLLRTGDCFRRAGIGFHVLKGAALSHLVYADPSWRVFSDVDLLVPSDQMDAAVRLACDELGGVQEVPELRPGFDREFGKEAMVRVGRVELDLHRTFVTGPFGLTLDLDGLFRDGTSFELGGTSFTTLEPSALFLHACYNVALGDLPVRLCALRDMLAIAENLAFDRDAIVNLATTWRATAVVQRAVRLGMEILELESDHRLAPLALLSVPRRQALLLRSYLTPARSYSRPLASLIVIRGLRARLRYARALVSPSAAYLDSRGWTERTHLRRAGRRLLRRG